MDWYVLNVVLHVLAAAIWLGGLVFLAAVMVPLVRSLPPPQGPRLLALAGRKTRYVSWPALLVLVITGIINAHHFQIVPEQLQEGTVLTSRFGRLLTAKVGLSVGLLALSLVHDLWLGPKLSQLLEESSDAVSPSTSPARGLRRQVVWLARLNLLFTVVIVVLAVVMVR